MLYKSKYYASICRIIEKLIDVNLVNDDVNLVNDMYFHFDYSDKSYLRYACFTKSARIFPLNPFFVFFSENINRFIDYRVTDSKCYNGFSQINKPFKFSWINHILLVIIDSFSKCCEINAVSLTYGSLQILPWSNDFILEEIDGSKWCRHITVTSFNICMPETKMYQIYHISPC